MSPMSSGPFKFPTPTEEELERVFPIALFSAPARAKAALDMAITVHNAAIEEAAKVAEDTRGIEHRHIVAEAIRKLKRAP